LNKHFLHGTQPGNWTGKHLSKHSPIFFLSSGVNFSLSRLIPDKNPPVKPLLNGFPKGEPFGNPFKSP